MQRFPNLLLSNPKTRPSCVSFTQKAAATHLEAAQFFRFACIHGHLAFLQTGNELGAAGDEPGLLPRAWPKCSPGRPRGSSSGITTLHNNTKPPKVAIFLNRKSTIPFLKGSHLTLLLQSPLHSTLKTARLQSKYPNTPPLNALTAAPCLSSCSGRCYLNMLAVMVQRQGKISLFWFSCYPIPAAFFPLKSI